MRRCGSFASEEGLLYVQDDDSIKRPFNDPPIVVNYFFNEEIIPGQNAEEQVIKLYSNMQKARSCRGEVMKRAELESDI